MASTDLGQKGFFLQSVNQAEATKLQSDFSVCSCSFRELVVDSVLYFCVDTSLQAIPMLCLLMSVYLNVFPAPSFDV